MILIPVILLVVIVGFLSQEWGILLFVFLFPIINNLPYFFGIHDNIPYAPTALVVFLAYFFGWMLNLIRKNTPLYFDHRIFKPIFLFLLLIGVSGLMTFWRYTNFFPIFSEKIYELVVNVNNLRAGGAIMSCVFNFLNYLTGFLFFIIMLSAPKSKHFIKKLLVTISVSTFIALLFALLQKYHDPSLGNTPVWVIKNQINSTFKDPNSFAAFLSALLPVFLAMIFFSRRRLKIFLVGVLGLSLFVFPSIGSRSAFLALFIATVIILFWIFFSSSIRPKKKIIVMSSAFLLVGIIAISLVLLPQSILVERLEWSFDTIIKGDSLNILSIEKLRLWTVSFQMIKNYPFTGIGLGGYIVELPNYLKSMGQHYAHTDSAENYFIQVGSELGIVGLFLILWIFVEIMKQGATSWKLSRDKLKEKAICLGVTFGLASLGVNYLFHSFIGSYEIKYTFWLLVSILFFLHRPEESPTVSHKIGRKFKLTALALIVVFGSVQLWHSTHSLSIKNQSEKYGWQQNFGLYKLEQTDSGVHFRWTKQMAGICLDNIGPIVVLPLMASHPDITTNPVKVKIFHANSYFRKKNLVREIILEDSKWVDFESSLVPSPPKKAYFVFDVNRVWQPKKSLGIPDTRFLGIALGNEWYKYPSELPKKDIISTKIVSAKDWQGDFKDALIAFGTSRIHFRTSQEKIALRLWVKGQKAYDVGPYIIIRLDEEVIGKTVLLTNDWEPLIFSPPMRKGDHILSVEYVNDIYDPQSQQDRNVYLGNLDVISLAK
jgi:hypothetical protein